MLKEGTGTQFNLTLKESELQTQRQEMMQDLDKSFVKLMKAIDAYSSKSLTKTSVRKLIRENKSNLEKHGNE